MDQQKNMICTSSFIYVNVSLKLFIQSPECLKETTLALHSNLSWFTLFLLNFDFRNWKICRHLYTWWATELSQLFRFLPNLFPCWLKNYRLCSSFDSVPQVLSHCRISHVSYNPKSWVLFNPNSKALFLPSLLFCEILNFTSILKKSPKTIK